MAAPQVAASAPASAVIGVAPAASAPLVFRREAGDAGFPVAGAFLLVGLLLVTAVLWWRRVRPANAPARGPWASWGLTASRPADVKLLSSTRLDAAVRLHVVEWKGRQLLLATSGTGVPVVLDRLGADAPEAVSPPREGDPQ